MEQEPSRRQDPLALIVLGVAVVLIAVIGLFLLYSMRQPASQPDAAGAESFPQQIRSEVRRLVGEAQKAIDPPAPVAKPQPKPQPRPPQPQAQAPKPLAQESPPAQAGAPQRGRVVLDAGRSWRYNVKVQPEVWKDVTLTYRTAQEAGGMGVRTDFLYAGGKSAFNLGIFTRGHPSHANTRFPGFFMYAAYLDLPLEIGQPVGFGWHWQGKSMGSSKRFEGKVTSWEELELPGGKLSAARIEGTLSYHEDGNFRGRAHETFWFAPKVAQVVKIVRQGHVPDESVGQIVAELAEYR